MELTDLSSIIKYLRAISDKCIKEKRDMVEFEDVKLYLALKDYYKFPLGSELSRANKRASILYLLDSIGPIFWAQRIGSLSQLKKENAEFGDEFEFWSGFFNFSYPEQINELFRFCFETIFGANHIQRIEGRLKGVLQNPFGRFIDTIKFSMSEELPSFDMVEEIVRRVKKMLEREFESEHLQKSFAIEKLSNFILDGDEGRIVTPDFSSRKGISAIELVQMVEEFGKLLVFIDRSHPHIFVIEDGWQFNDIRKTTFNSYQDGYFLFKTALRSFVSDNRSIDFSQYEERMTESTLAQGISRMKKGMRKFLREVENPVERDHERGGYYYFVRFGMPVIIIS